MCVCGGGGGGIQKSITFYLADFGIEPEEVGSGNHVTKSKVNKHTCFSHVSLFSTRYVALNLS